MNINSLNIDTSDMTTAVTKRKLIVSGDIGARFDIFIIETSTSKFYNFFTKEFTVGHSSSQDTLSVTLEDTGYQTDIIFPSGGGTYIIKLIALHGTNIQNSRNNILTKTITKLSSNTTITFKAETANTSNYTTFPTTTSTGAFGNSSNVNFNWDITNVSNDSHGFGFRLTGNHKYINDKFWYTKATTTVDGAISSSKVLVVDSVDGIGVGTTLSSGTGLSGTPIVLSVDVSAKSLLLSTAQSLSDGVALVFKSISAKIIKAATGLDLTFINYPTVSPTTLTKTARATSSSTTLNLNGTYGIAGGNHVTYTGFGVDNSSANAVTSVSASSTAGSVVVQNAQTISAETIITFAGCHQVINFDGNIDINSFSSTNETVYLDIDQLITVGAAS